MANQNELKIWVKDNCPILWGLLNTKAKKQLPKGLIEYIGEGSSAETEAGRDHLISTEMYLKNLQLLCGRKKVGDNYRRDFSGVSSENQLSELLCEIALCASLGRIADNLRLRPPTGRGTFSDCLINLQGFDVYAEAKRYSDPWPHIEKPGCQQSKKVPYSRSIAKSPSGEKPHNTARPRSMDLRSKLQDVYRQFPDRTLNILFVFHSSFGESKRYLTQALFGDSNFFKNGRDFALEEDGLFSNEDWRNITACCLSRVNPDSKVIYPFIWANPRAHLNLPAPVLAALKLQSNA